MVFFTQMEKSHKIHVKPQKTVNNQSNSEQEE